MNLAPLVTPVQPRAKRSYEALLRAAQEVLAEGGYDALNSNSIVERAELTPPTFYRYFRDKHMLLGVLAQRLLDAQNELVKPLLETVDGTFLGSVDALEQLLIEDIKLTRSFTGSGELIVLMRALPGLRAIRLNTHKRMSNWLADATRNNFPDLPAKVIRIRARLATDLYFATLEMLLETEFRNQAVVVRRAAIAIESAMSLPDK